MDDACSAVWQTVGMLPLMVSTAQAAELLEQALVVGEHVGRQCGGKRGALLDGGINLCLEVGRPWRGQPWYLPSRPPRTWR